LAQRLVIRSYAPARRWLVIGGSCLVVVASLYAAFEYGRSRAGYDVARAVDEQGRLVDRIAELEKEAAANRRELAAAETARVGQARERADVSRTIGELQAQVARQAQDLAFYRGLVSDGPQAPVVRIQQFRVTAGAAADTFQLRLVLGRPVRPEDAINGTVDVTLEGTRTGQPATLGLASLSADAARELRFNFRYLQTLDLPVKLPAGFTPARVTVEVKVNRKGVEPLRQTFLWTVEAA
jgi:hypothetical protein